MAKYRIEKDIPIASRKNKFSIYPFAEMEVNDSFFVPNIRQQTLSSAAYYFSKKHPPKKFATRQENNGSRVWRIQ